MKVGDKIRFYKEKHIYEIIGEIIEEHDRYYRFKILECNKPWLVGRTAIFQKNGKLIKYIEVI